MCIKGFVTVGSKLLYGFNRVIGSFIRDGFGEIERNFRWCLNFVLFLRCRCLVVDRLVGYNIQGAQLGWFLFFHFLIVTWLNSHTNK